MYIAILLQTSFPPSNFAELLSGSYSEVPLNEEIDCTLSADVHSVLSNSAEHQQLLDHHHQNDVTSGLLPSFQETYAACTGVGFKMEEDYASPVTSADTMATSAATFHLQQQQQQLHNHIHHHHDYHQNQHNNHHHLNQLQQHNHHELPIPAPSLIHFDYHFQHFPGGLPQLQPLDSPTSAEHGGNVSVFEPMLDHINIKQQPNHHQQNSQVVIGHHQQLLPAPPAPVLLVDTGTGHMQHTTNNNSTMQNVVRSRRMSSSAVLHRNATNSSDK